MLLSVMSLHREVLKLYRQILRLSRKWESALGNPGATEAERQYIADEARKLFRKNKHKKDEEEIREHITEAEARIEIALHYKNPYPRPVHLPQHVLHSKVSKRLKGQKRKLEQSQPVYIKSYEEDT